MITVYSAPWCAFCHAAKEYLNKLGVVYEEKDIETDPKFAEEAVAKSGQMGIPVITVADEVIIGFDRPKIDNALRAHKLMP
jgi:glutaredoxin-like YruB-family protein